MGWNNQVVNLIVVTVTTTGQSGIFGYSPTVGAGNLLFSLTAAGGTDPYGNTYPAGLNFQFTDGSQIVEYAGNYTNAAGTITPATWITLKPKNATGQTWQPAAIGTNISQINPTRAGIVVTSPWNSSTPPDGQSSLVLFNQGNNSDGKGSIAQLFGSNVFIGAPSPGPDITVGPTDIIFESPNNFTFLTTGTGVQSTNKLNGSTLYRPPAGITVGSWQPIGTGAFAPFLNGFHDRALGGNFPAPAYLVDAFGNTRLRGAVTGNASSTIGSAILQLPAGLRPSATMMLPVASNNGAEVYGRVDVQPDGNVVWRGPTVVTAGSNWFTINIEYLTEQ